MEAINSYRDLKVWQAGRRLVLRIYQATRNFPPEERFGLTSQMRRAAVSIPSNIAEGWSRQHRAEYLQFLRVARGSLAELETQVLLSQDLVLMPETTFSELLNLCDALSRQLLALERALRRPLPPSPFPPPSCP